MQEEKMILSIETTKPGIIPEGANEHQKDLATEMSVKSVLEYSTGATMHILEQADRIVREGGQVGHSHVAICVHCIHQSAEQRIYEIATNGKHIPAAVPCAQKPIPAMPKELRELFDALQSSTPEEFSKAFKKIVEARHGVRKDN